jgi:hypothetical protein
MSCRSSIVASPERVRRIHRGVLDGLSYAGIAPGEAALVTRVKRRGRCR